MSSGSETSNEGDTPLKRLSALDATGHLERAVAFIHGCAGVEHYRVDVETPSEGVVEWTIRALRPQDIAPGTSTPGDHVFEARVDGRGRIREFTATLRSPLPYEESGLLFAPRPTVIPSVGLLYDFVFLHLCVGIRCLRTLRDYLQTVGGPWLELKPTRNADDRIILELRNKMIPSLSVAAYVQPDLSLVLPEPERQQQERDTAITGARMGARTRTKMIPLVPSSSTPIKSKTAAHTGAAFSGDDVEPVYETQASPAIYIEHCGFADVKEGDQPKLHPITHEMICVLTEYTLCAPMPSAPSA
jgi:hypothetical protein